MSGKRIVDCGLRIADLKSRLRGSLLSSPQCAIRNSPSRGFTLLELMIVISIIVILAVIAMPQYQKTVIHAKETVLRDNLFQIRKMIDQYAADKGKLPTSLEELVSAGYMRDIPPDPITGEKDWTLTTGEDPGLMEGGTGITNIHSSSTDASTEGTPYSEW